MLEHIADFTAWPILTGIFIGYIANRIMSGEGKGCCMNLVIGIVGSYVGTLISHLLNIELFGKGYLTNFGNTRDWSLSRIILYGYNLIYIVLFPHDLMIVRIFNFFTQF